MTGPLDNTNAVVKAGHAGTQVDPNQAPSLRSAILDANANAGSSPHTISLPPGVYDLTLGELPVGPSGNITATILRSGAVSGATTATLTINLVGVADAGSYDVVVANTRGPATSVAVSPAVTAHVADFDGDGDVDLGDFAHLSACFNGPNRPPAGC